MTFPDRPLPIMSPHSKPFWEGCRRHELLFPRCDRCAATWLPSGPVCPECWSVEWAWIRSQGVGTVYSWVVFRRAYHPAWTDAIPYVVAVVELAEGPRLSSNLIDCDPASVTCGMPVEVVFDTISPEITLPRFGPLRPGEAAPQSAILSTGRSSP
jgi:uncharacterized OB-fold protein